MPSVEAIVEVVKFLTIGGAAAVALYVLTLIVNGKLHSNSEVEGLRKDKESLTTQNDELAKALAASNETIEALLSILRRADDKQIIAILRALNLEERG